MAEQTRAAANLLIEDLKREPYRFDFFQVLRQIECLYAEKPRLGTAGRVADDPVRLAQEADLNFPPSTLAACEDAVPSGVPRLAVRFFGLFGPQGPLPLHLTEYARERIRNENDRTFAHFADIFHHRMLSLFYRAWANSQPTVNYDRPEEDRFAFYVGSLFGLADASSRHRDALPDRAKLFYSGHLACQAKHADGLSAMLRGFFRVPVRIQEFVGEWMEIAPSDQTRLGFSLTTCALGHSAVVGGRVWGRQHKFRVVAGPMGLQQYRAFLPGGSSLSRLTAVVRNYIGDELAWDANLVLKRDEVPALCLDGGAQLGWTTWLGDPPKDRRIDDLLLNPFFHELRAQAEADIRLETINTLVE
jgi:type VI secretion system protein ImpH